MDVEEEEDDDDDDDDVEGGEGVGEEDRSQDQEAHFVGPSVQSNVHGRLRRGLYFAW